MHNKFQIILGITLFLLFICFGVFIAGSEIQRNENTTNMVEKGLGEWAFNKKGKASFRLFTREEIYEQVLMERSEAN